MRTEKEKARREINLAKVSDSDERSKEINRHYEIAYESFCYFLDRSSELNNPEAAKAILFSLLKGENLSPIEDLDEDWELICGMDSDIYCGSFSIYQCLRRPSLFKKVAQNKIEFIDKDRAIFIDIDSKNEYDIDTIALKILDEEAPITFPYLVSEKIKVYTDHFNSEGIKDAIIDTFGILFFLMPSGELKEVKRFFKIDSDGKIVEICSAEYFQRKIDSTSVNREE